MTSLVNALRTAKTSQICAERAERAQIKMGKLCTRTPWYKNKGYIAARMAAHKAMRIAYKGNSLEYKRQLLRAAIGITGEWDSPSLWEI